VESPPSRESQAGPEPGKGATGQEEALPKGIVPAVQIWLWDKKFPKVGILEGIFGLV